MAAPVNPLVRLRRYSNGNPYYWVEESRPGHPILDNVFHPRFGIPYPGVLKTFLLLVSPGEGDAPNCVDGLFNPHPFGIAPSRFHGHHQLTFEEAKAQDPAYHGADSGSRWISHYSAVLCHDIFQAAFFSGQFGAFISAQILETGVADPQEFPAFKDAVVRLCNREHDAVPAAVDIAAVRDYANNANNRNGFHASLIGPIVHSPDNMRTVSRIIDDRSLNEHVRIFTGDFVTNEHAAAICAHRGNIFPVPEDDYGDY
jgi:hypothetical protein